MTTNRSVPSFLERGGEMGALMRAKDWSATPLGAPETWPQSLRSAVSILLPSKAQIALFWGPELITLYNDAYRPVFGGKHPHVLGQPIRQAWSELWRAGLRELFENVVRTGEAYWAKDRPFYMERHGFPEETFFDVSYDPVRDESGAVGGLFCIVNETTVRVLGERRLEVLRDLAASGAEARDVQQACTDAVRILAKDAADVPFAIVYLLDGHGPRIVAMAGVHAGEILDEWPLCNGPMFIDDLQRCFRRVPAGPWPEPPRSAMVLPVGGGALVLGISSRLRWDDAYRGFFDLVAGQLEASIAGAQAAEQERRRVEALAELDRAKTTFFSNVSHEFRTPLTLMLGPIEDLLDRSDHEPLNADRSTLASVRRNGQRLLKLVNTLLDFARIEAGRFEASYEPTDLGCFTAELASIFRSACERAGLVLEVNCPRLAEVAYVDRGMWEKIVLNLVSNALKFTLEGTIRVAVSEVGGKFELEVSDTGVGIPAEHIPRLFERFHRVETRRGRSHEGSGIGLALVQELVKLHGGMIAARSEPGLGTTFTVSLPKGTAHLPEERLQSRGDEFSMSVGAAAYVDEALGWIRGAESAPSVRHHARDTPRLLLVDDNADLRDYACRLLAEHYEVDTAVDGEAALEAARQRPPDLVIADVMMPRMDGFALLAALRADPMLREVPVMLLSARAGEEARVHGLGLGADEYMVKPFAARELLVRVGALLRSAKIRSNAHRARREFLDAAPAMLWATESDGGCSFVSRGWHEFTGQTEGEALGSGWLDSVHPDDRFRSAEAVRNANAKRNAFDIDYRLRCRDGSYRWVLGSGRPRFGEHGEFLGHVGSVIDVHERREAEERLRESEARYRAVVESQSEMVCRFRPDGQILFANEGYARAVGTSVRELLCRNFWEFIPESEHEDVRRLLARLTPDSPDVRVENRFETAEGERWTLWHNRALRFDSEGNVVEAQSTGIDITDRKRMESALRDSEERLRLFIDNAPAAIAMFDRDMCYVAVSQRFKDDYGLSGDVMGKCHYECFPDLPPSWLEAHRRGLAGASVHSEGDRFDRADGVVQWVKWDVLPWRTASGEVGGILLAAEDITARKEAERHKDEFIATLSHELRNPLAPLRNGLLLLRLSGGSQGSEIVDMMQRQVDHLVRLTDDLLEMSRITQGTVELRRQKIDLAVVVRHALEASGALIQERGHRLRLSLPDEPLVVDGDPVRLAQIFSNLLNNAARYTPAGGSIEILASREDAIATVAVRDDGVGIGPEQMSRLFHMFGRGESSRGLGIGLALSQRLAEMHGGAITAASDGVGKGAEFIVRLPLGCGVPLVKSAAGTAMALDGLRILVVDDNQDAADSLGMVLRSLGAVVRVAHDGRGGLAAFDVFRPVIVLLDIGMPDMDGYEVARAIRASQNGMNVCLVALTGWGQEDDRLRSQAAGFDHHLVKPADIDGLRAVIESFADR